MASLVDTVNEDLRPLCLVTVDPYNAIKKLSILIHQCRANGVTHYGAAISFKNIFPM